MSSVQMWGADAPTTGAYKENQVAPIFKPAAYASMMFDLAQKRKVAMGESLTIPAYENLSFPTSMLLDEAETIPLSKLTITAKKISLSERGRAVAISGKTQNRSPFDVLEAHKDAISKMMSRELEEVISTALKLTPIKAALASATSQVITTNGATVTAAGSQPNFYHLQNLGSLMSDSYRIPHDPRFGGYVGIFRGNGLLGVQRDSEWRTAFQGQGLSPVSKLNIQGQIGEIVLMKTNDSRVLSNSIGTSSLYSEGLLLGDEAVLFGFIEQIGLSYDFSVSKATDFGRFKYIAMLGDYGAGIYSDSANADLVRSIHVTST